MDNSGKSAFGLDQNVAAGLAYIPVCLCHLIVSIGIIATDNTNKLPRFHAIQSLLLSAVMIAAYLVCIVLVFLIMLAAIVGLIISCIKAFQGQIFKLPIIGNLADKWSN